MKKFLRIVLLVVVAIATAIAIFYAWTDWAGARHWKAVEAELRAKGEPVTIADIVPKPIPDEMNFSAAPIFAEMRTESDQSKWRISQIQNFRGGYRKGSSLLANAARSVDPKFNGSDADAAHVILTQMDKWKPLLDEVREAAQRPGTDWKINYSELVSALLVYEQPLMTLGQIFSTEARAYLELGDSEAALADFHLILNLSDRTSPPPFLISYLVQQAMVGLDIDAVKFGIERHVWTASQLEIIQHALGNIALRAKFIEALRVERTVFNDNLLRYNQRAAQGVAQPLDPDSDKQKVSFGDRVAAIAWKLHPAGWINEDRCAFSDDIQRLIQGLASENPYIPSDFMSPSVASPVGNFVTPFANLTIRVLPPLVPRALYYQIYIDEARTACAIERYRLVHGSLPPNLVALCPEYLSSVPLDLMSGNALLYRPGPGDSYVLYSVGWNQKDDGGSDQNTDHRRGNYFPHPPDTLDWVWKIGNPS